MKYIDSEKLIAEIERIIEEETPISKGSDYYHGVADTADKLLSFITSFQQERGPHTESWLETTKKELQHEEELLDMRLEALRRIRDKKNQFQQEQPNVDLEKEIDSEWVKCNPTDEGMGLESANIVNEQFNYIARHFYELSRARKEE